MENKIAWEKYPEGNKREEVFQFAENYRKFISDCKTERECVTSFVEKAEKAGFVNLEKVIAEHTALKTGDRVYANNMGKGMALFVIGKESMEKGMNILGAHIDSPRLDLKQDPLYEDTDFAMLDTHYYGGIKKYQWVTLPLALHGVIAKKDGTVVKVNVGDKPGDPVFGVSDLLIHLSGEQLEKKAAQTLLLFNFASIACNKSVEGLSSITTQFSFSRNLLAISVIITVFPEPRTPVIINIC